MFILINIYRSLTLFMVVFPNEALGYETHAQCWRHKTDVVTREKQTARNKTDTGQLSHLQLPQKAAA